MSSVDTATEIQQIFNRIAPKYDDLNQWISLGQHQIWKKMAVKWSGVQAGDTALDICCGSGDLTLILAQTVGVMGKTTGIDFAAQQLAIAAAKQARQCPEFDITWQEGDALDLPFDDHHFDGVTIGYGLRNVTNIPLALAEVYRVLKPGKKVAILDFHRPADKTKQAFQQWYMQTVVVPLAERFKLTAEYEYIQPSIERFPPGKVQEKLAYEAGFSEAIHYPFAGDMMGVLVATK
ncbi:bifunctional demethylmenaquinone methyltransferase/2-methoxy-6-polyprenyl-1,4-benzoquinol methylase UbiE [[Limnothrix rosea] IAM M-220]|uniref:bifunctional demethylmenaquinone methyltransferase/2-methoxy-6-polyprenyl-1,4-benzoquinol methylase UbiE n=1 Tax=[Limnothrix rosea] IAM M-220 TaxID=454133 RepID=UPI00095B5B29|nr:bifunctional demethylmenaquinone methyltransferase/2-methoxy-6-polyprenyl-1,4-benzoquinol methylase UbiE [[Limnothrix rosea] IAM M-220]OKH11763.1 bifunctional demethylmenaquinone methyltransferase/2-methoxy-6-polyprenyl-1,4-benzoquinol methylase [[Limnothrix rosea] IAM M-220]